MVKKLHEIKSLEAVKNMKISIYISIAQKCVAHVETLSARERFTYIYCIHTHIRTYVYMLWHKRVTKRGANR